ncbi:CHT1 [Mytilus edulis]|uniref:SLC5A7 n=1 Tax=Mytilus edulis TaxID=6550 RepID=A0A8S3SNM7_MYTED|nr:CHT1 [Mytilus edulis]
MYVIRMPELTCALWFEKANGYGSLVGFIFGLLLRILGGEPVLSLPAVIKYPWYDPTVKDINFTDFAIKSLCWNPFIAMHEVSKATPIEASVTAQGFVKLSGNQQIRRFGIVRLNCSSNHTPIENEARIQIDGKPYTTISSLSVGCLSSVLAVVCQPYACACSNRGLWFSHTYKVVQHIGVINFTCLMTFKRYGSYSNSISVKVIDDIHIIGPNERCPTIPIYHSAPALDNTQNAYDTPETGYLQVINEQYELNHFRDTEIAEEENSTLGSDYDEIDI